MMRGSRGLPPLTLADLLQQQRGHINIQNRPRLTIKQVLEWADQHKQRTGKWPRHISGAIPGTDESWTAIESALQRGRRGLPADMSIAKLLGKYRGHRNRQSLPKLSIAQILQWADQYRDDHQRWPQAKSGKVLNTAETWNGLDAALMNGGRGLRGGSSLAQLLADRRGYRNPAALPRLTIKQILKWADAHRRSAGSWPKATSGPIANTGEQWHNVNQSLNKGTRGLPGGTTLADLLAKYRRAPHPKKKQKLSVRRIWQWVLRHYHDSGEWPRKSRDNIPGSIDTWFSIDNALRSGLRGLPGGSSLAQLIDHRRRRK
jgi:hypothetical protein